MFSRVRWMIIWLLFLAGLINYMDRAALSVAAPLVAKDLRLDPAQLGLVFSVFFFGYALFCFVGGYFSDRVGPKRVFTVSMVAWSVFCGLTGAVFSFASLLVVRVLFGMGEGPLSSTMNKTVSQWFPRREQASAVGMANAGTPLGGALAGPVVGLIAIGFGWRISFVIIAIIGLAWTLAWALLATDRPAQHPWMRASELAEIEADRGAPETAGQALPLRDYLRRPAVLATAFAFFGYADLLYFFLAWFPSYLTMARHLSVKSMSLVTVIPWLLGFLGLALGGFLTDAVFRRTGRAVFARKLVLVGCLLLAAVCVALAGLATSVGSAVALMAASVFFLYLTGNTYWAIILDTVEGGKVGGVSGFVHLIANLAGIVSPAVTGLLVQWTGAFTSAFVLAGAMAVIGALAVAIWVRAPGQAAVIAQRPARALP
ncbi:MAG TPA: MFS transporter [Acetobacteraceae bacterium]|nr:MFS transporter [Acetobacteraceae bacterium]